MPVRFLNAEESARLRALAEAQGHILHPFGRCTCAGEGTCEWCRLPCKSCGEGAWKCLCKFGPVREKP